MHCQVYYQQHNRAHNYYTGLNILHPGSQCIENSIQLIGELSQQAGLPVICLGGRWGKICDFLDTPVAVVVCRQLGFSIESNNLLHM